MSEMSSTTRNNVKIFLAYQMPECQDDSYFSNFALQRALTIKFLAYQMPSIRLLEKT